MTGQIAFARTIRALDADHFRAPKIGSFFAIVLLAAWTWWFFTAPIPEYVTTTRVQLNQNSALADFPPTIQILSGQHARIISPNGDIIQAQVENVRDEPNRTQVEFNLLSSAQSPVPSPQPQRAAASIEVNRATPASIVLRAIR